MGAKVGNRESGIGGGLLRLPLIDPANDEVGTAFDTPQSRVPNPANRRFA